MGVAERATDRNMVLRKDGSILVARQTGNLIHVGLTDDASGEVVTSALTLEEGEAFQKAISLACAKLRGFLAKP